MQESLGARRTCATTRCLRLLLNRSSGPRESSCVHCGGLVHRHGLWLLLRLRRWLPWRLSRDVVVVVRSTLLVHRALPSRGKHPVLYCLFPSGNLSGNSALNTTPNHSAGPIQYAPGSAASQSMQGSALLGLSGLVCVRRKTQKQFVPSPFLFNCFTFSNTRYLSRSRPLSSSAPPLLRTHCQCLVRPHY